MINALIIKLSQLKSVSKLRNCLETKFNKQNFKLSDSVLQIIKANPNWPVYADALSIHLHGLHLYAQYGQTWHLLTH